MDYDKEYDKKKRQFLKINLIHIGKGIKSLRKLHGMTLDDLSVDTKIDTGYLSRLENGLCKPRIDTVSSILAVFNLSMKEFFDYLDSIS